MKRNFLDKNGSLAVILELQANRIILDELSNCYGMFLFTGGDVPRTRWGLVALASIDYPFAADRIASGDVERYRHLAEAIMALGEAVAVGRPRTMRSRKEIADRFGAASSEIRRLESTLEAAMTKGSQEFGPLSAISGLEPAVSPRKLDVSPVEAVG